MKKQVIFDLKSAIVLINLLQQPQVFNFTFTIAKEENYDTENLRRYKELLLSISWFLNKVKRYVVYFKEFYQPSGDVSEHEALEHHIHAYIEDLQTLREKLLNLNGAIKNDLKKISNDTQKIEANYTIRKEKIIDVFGEVSDARRPHRHQGFIYVDPSVVRAKEIDTLLSDSFKSFLTEDIIKQLMLERTEITLKGKEKWIKMAQSNFPETENFVDLLISSMSLELFMVLGVQRQDVEALVIRINS